jgi:putative pyruvate formate lyase activating enzyme
MVHRGEEPIISGTRGSGTVFFSGCNLGCVFCQNYDISQSCDGSVVTVPELVELFMKLETKGVHNINLVTPSHYVQPIAEAIKQTKAMGIKIPFVYNSNGYDAIASLEMMDGLIDIYMPDLKYANDDYGQRYSNVPEYFTVASKALLEMSKQVGEPVITNGVMQRGILIRHLVMPGLQKNSFVALDWVKANIPKAIVNVMPQYRPEYQAEKYPEINRRPTNSEYRAVVTYLNKLGLQSC